MSTFFLVLRKMIYVNLAEVVIRSKICGVAFVWLRRYVGFKTQFTLDYQLTLGLLDSGQSCSFSITRGKYQSL